LFLQTFNSLLSDKIFELSINVIIVWLNNFESYKTVKNKIKSWFETIKNNPEKYESVIIKLELEKILDIEYKNCGYTKF